MSDIPTIKCANRKCGLIVSSEDWKFVPDTERKNSRLHCPRCFGTVYLKAKPGEVEKPKTGAELISLERIRQQKIEGWSLEHDDGYKRSSRDAYIQRLREKGYIAADGNNLAATESGIAALPDAQPLPTGAELQAYWLRRLPAGEKRILEFLIQRYPEPAERQTISNATGYQRSSRDAYLQRLRAKELITDPEPGVVQASENLFT